MPRITICGMNSVSAKALRHQLFSDPNLFFGRRWIFQVVIEILESNVSSLCEDQPFLILADTPGDPAHDEITDILRTNGFEFEELALKAFNAKPGRLNRQSVFIEIWERPLGVTETELVTILAEKLGDEKTNKVARTLLKRLVDDRAVRKDPDNKYRADIEQLRIFLSRPQPR